MVAFAALAALSAVSLVAAHPYPSGSEAQPGLLPGRWYHDDDHSVHALFRRQPAYHIRDPKPEVGSSAWANQYPDDAPDPSQLPQAWLKALNDAVSNGQIPNYPPSTSENNATPVYPDGINENRNNATICANSDGICRIPQDIWDGPDGYFGVGFDDGPLPPSPGLYDFLQQNNVPSTHYFIGTNIRDNWQAFQQCYNISCDIAVHTWTHPFMTTQTNEQVLGELGYTMQIIYDMTGKVPRFWRPPYGDIDTRVSAIAREVFGMTAVLWNHDTEDWTMDSNPPGTNLDAIQSNMEKWLSGPKSPGLIILEHELMNETVQAFINAFPLIGQNGWKIESQARLNGATPYQDGQEADQPFNSLIAPSSTSSAPATSTTASDSASASATTSRGGLSTESNKSGSRATIVFPSLVTFGVFIGGVLALM